MNKMIQSRNGAARRRREWRNANASNFSVWVVVIAVGCFSVLTSLADNPNSIIYSKHNLSVSSLGTVHASSETEVCIFCHTPHHATGDGALWNHAMSGATYQPYTSLSMKATVGQPTGSSRLCLSCHDGTVALGSVQSRSSMIAMNDGMLPSTSPDFVGTDLTTTHPVSFTYNNSLAVADGNLVYPNALPPEVQLDNSGQMQCTSCHDPHNDQYGNFLVQDNSKAGLCLNCHVLSDWANSGHGLSGATLPAVVARLVATQSSSSISKTAKATAKPMTVSAAGCAACHVPHAAGGKASLTWFTVPEKNCFSCHNGGGPGLNLADEFNKISVHPISLNSDSHSSAEDPINPPERHVTCADCHNPHAANKNLGGPVAGSGSLAGVKGVAAGGSVVRNITREYELCFRCHGDSAARGPARVPRQFVQTNTRIQFNPGNTSFHPIETVGKNPSVPSLIPPLTASSVVTCEDCHNNDQGPGNGGSGPKGPHGSAFVPLLERRLLLADGTPYNPDDSALCYKCHNSMVVDSDLPTSWSGHRKHIEVYRAACTTCHDSHASSQPHLINFNTIYVQPNNGVLRYVSTGLNHGSCTLTCHDGSGVNHAHVAQSY
jgi:predicted CXXCH cytochrome family protein